MEDSQIRAGKIDGEGSITAIQACYNVVTNGNFITYKTSQKNLKFRKLLKLLMKWCPGPDLNWHVP
ncbi:MAG: hypothetical protein HOO06_03565 [Bdellovibrionaceae bacterium]|jgi:hypothetical protein|nr:hypothetical protein [Pseudobdellovibrionaceae bacterium]